MKVYIVLILLLTSLNIFAQANWRFEPKIERNNHYLLEGNIAGKYPITMYLEGNGLCLYEYRGNIISRLKGWYYYNNRKIKLPLIGSETIPYSDRFSICKVTLYVPANISDSIRENSCDLENYKEIFVTNEAYSFDSLQWKWRTKNNNSFLPVELKVKNRPSAKTKSYISLYVRGIEMFSFNLTDNLKDLKDAYGNAVGSAYIETIELKASKEIGNDFYLIFSFSQPSNPGSWGMGSCGVGYEDYLGFLHISSFEVKEFKFVQIGSCLRVIEEEYTFDTNAPEKGITVRKNE